MTLSSQQNTSKKCLHTLGNLVHLNNRQNTEKFLFLDRWSCFWRSAQVICFKQWVFTTWLCHNGGNEENCWLGHWEIFIGMKRGFLQNCGHFDSEMVHVYWDIIVVILKLQWKNETEKQKIKWNDMYAFRNSHHNPGPLKPLVQFSHPTNSDNRDVL